MFKGKIYTSTDYVEALVLLSEISTRSGRKGLSRSRVTWTSRKKRHFQKYPKFYHNHHAWLSCDTLRPLRFPT